MHFFLIGILCSVICFFPSIVHAQTSISQLSANASSVRVYEKYEAKFSIGTTAKHTFFEYTASPPPGVTAGTGVNVYAVITTPSGKTVRHPLFFMTEILRTNGYYEETNNTNWTLRLAPLEVGSYRYYLEVEDSQGKRNSSQFTFTATTPTKPGFVRVSKADTRYFEYTNGTIFWPLGTADDFTSDFSVLAGSGINMMRPWWGALGMYSTNWARWKSSAEEHGNEGIKTRFSVTEHAPGSDLSYELFYPEGFRIWISNWLDNDFGPRIKNGRVYQATLRYKTVNIAGNGGLSVKASNYQPWNNPSMQSVLSSLSTTATGTNTNNTQTFSNMYQLKNSSGWQTVSGTLTANSDKIDLYVYLDDVTAGQAYVDMLSIRECISGNCANLGGEVVRNPYADEHTYVEQRPAAYVDDLIIKAENAGIFFKTVVHDKNDWIQSHLNDAGQFVATLAEGNGYNPPYNTKARWLLRQWYRYMAARWGYSTAIHTWEMQNEGDPNDTHHWQAAQDFAKYMHEQDAHPHLATTSFWCCWRSAFFGNNTLYPDIDYGDLHQYTVHTEPSNGPNYRYDFAAFNYDTAKIMAADNIKKPLWRAETGLAAPGTFGPDAMLDVANTGVWLHNLLWPQLAPYVLYDPGYWFGNHKARVNMQAISKPFYNFVKSLDVHQGGYGDIAATNSNSNLRVWGQKNVAKNKAVVWFQNRNHTWKNVLDNVSIAPINGTQVTIRMNPNTSYQLEWWNTYTGATTNAQVTSNASGDIQLTIDGLADDKALKITGPGGANPTATPTVVPTSVPGDITGDGQVTIADIAAFIASFTSIFNYNAIIANYGK